MPRHMILTITFDQKISPGEIQYFRGAINKEMGKQSDILFHNHTETGLRYSYPLVQYKLTKGYASIVAIESAAEELHQFVQKGTFNLDIGNKKITMNVSELSEKMYEPLIEDSPKLYSIKKYIPLTDSNYSEYNNLLALTDKVCFIEKILTGNILSFFKGINYNAKDKIVCVITSIDNKEDVMYKGVKFLSFDLHFVSNVELPDNIGLGKSPSVGFGTIKKEKIADRFNKA